MPPKDFINTPPPAHPDVPKKYQGLPSAVVAILWRIPHHKDAQKQMAEQVLRDKALVALRMQEFEREHDREKFFDQMIGSISHAEQKTWALIEAIIRARITGHISGESSLERSVAPDEQALLTRLSLAHDEKVHGAKKKLKVVTLTLEDDFDRLVFRNLIKGLTLDAWHTLHELHQLIGGEAVTALKESARKIKGGAGVRIALGGVAKK